MNHETTRLIKKVFRKLGLSISRYNPKRYYYISHEIDLILDVGANEGQFAQGVRDHGYRKDIISFEPLSNAHSVLLKKS